MKFSWIIYIVGVIVIAIAIGFQGLASKLYNRIANNFTFCLGACNSFCNNKDCNEKSGETF